MCVCACVCVVNACVCVCVCVSKKEHGYSLHSCIYFAVTAMFHTSCYYNSITSESKTCLSRM